VKPFAIDYAPGFFLVCSQRFLLAIGTSLHPANEQRWGKLEVLDVILQGIATTNDRVWDGLFPRPLPEDS